MASLKSLMVPPLYLKIVSKFPPNFSFCFAYGSAVKKQLNNAITPANSNMIDLVFCVDDSYTWHSDNLNLNRSHYSGFKYLGHHSITNFQENYGAKVYFNTLVPFEDTIIKYGVISTKDLITDLLEWSDLYLAGRLHKPVDIVISPTNSELQTAIQLNLQSAVHAALLILPETFTEYQFYHAICNLSYAGDFRMIFGENKNKVANIVHPQIPEFRALYKMFMKNLHDYVDFPVTEETDTGKIINCLQDVSPLGRLHHLNQLPRWPQKALTKFWNRGSLRQDTEDVLRAVAYDPDCNVIVTECINGIVWRSSISQSLKSIITAVIFFFSINMSYIGPALPPHLIRKAQQETESNEPTSTEDEKVEDSKNNLFGPALPCQLKHTETKCNDTFGPTLPKHLQKVLDEDNEDVYGPLPADMSTNSLAHRALEERALQMKLNYLNPEKDEKPSREEWMMELPEVSVSRLGMGPRQFRKNAVPDLSDRSSWTDGPEQKDKKKSKKTVHVDLKKEAELKEIQKRDAQQADVAEKHNIKTKRNRSLLDQHQDKLKRKKMEEDTADVPTRRPFNRDIDLKVNQFDEAQKRSIIKKAMHLDDRFSSGDSKFL
ncbi:hypothetical protein FQA39_LY08347 [Lamprigera yunnana]|nr:hypothetical protein FQA39_LY08347 [Lamprigera yunnana]